MKPHKHAELIKASCSKCNDTGWVCENHPDQEAHKCIHCGGAGMPCECTTSTKPLSSLGLAGIALKHFGNPIPKEAYLFANEIMGFHKETKPLSDEEIKELSELTSDPDPTSFVRAIEERHGIK